MQVNSTNKGNKKRKVMSEINVTPFVDVMLVLLIIFMVTAPMLVTGVNVDLPQASTSPVSAQEEPLSVSTLIVLILLIDLTGTISIVITLSSNMIFCLKFKLIPKIMIIII